MNILKIRNIINYYYLIDSMTNTKKTEMSSMIFTVTALWRRVDLDGLTHPVMDETQNLKDQKFDFDMTSVGVL